MVKAQIDKIAGAVDKALQTVVAREKLGNVGLDVNCYRADEMARYLSKQSAQVADIIKKANIKDRQGDRHENELSHALAHSRCAVLTGIAIG